ncbi:MAG: LLM class flavin-dependent oxidoreductase [Dehalococcoidia bacterium]|nr:LLM class flavin-dependent oxidoreductase [Dehalococcoidia bacterium]
MTADSLNFGPSTRLRTGIFMAPFHRAGDNPTLALRRDLELLQRLDELGYDEAWIGEHHSAGWETIASPEVFIAAAAERTQRIRLGTGVVSLPYHNPFHVADRIVLLDHLTRGRVMLGVGPGALPSDAHMLGLDPTVLRPRMDEALGVIIQLLTADEPVTYKSDWIDLRDAQLQLKPFQRPTMPIAVASTLSPAGMTCAGKHGAGVLSVASYAPEGLQSLTNQWSFSEQAAAAAGRPPPDRANWRIVMPFHLADSREEAIRDIEDGVLAWNNDYFVGTIGAPMQTPAKDGREMAERLIAFGAIIGTPDDAVASVRRLQEVSGGFGCLLGLAHEWADREKTLRSYELMARYVMPQVQDTVTWINRSQQWTSERKQQLMGGATQAVLKAIADHTAAKAVATEGAAFTLPGSVAAGGQGAEEGE